MAGPLRWPASGQRLGRCQAAGPSPASRRWGRGGSLAAAAAAAPLAAALCHPGAGHAGTEALSGTAFEMFSAFLAQVEALGPYGPVLFVAAVAIAECVPLLPTQPLSLASGLLFGPTKGAALMLLGVCLAAANAYLISRTVGASLAARIVRAEGAGGGGGDAMSRKLAEVTAAIEGGGPLKQFTAIVLLRLTPVVPYRYKFTAAAAPPTTCWA